jgi:hypothetical protein
MKPMNTAKMIVTAFACLSLAAGCGSSTSWMPLGTTVWVGRGECERLENGTWVRRPEFDYSFSVEQNRNGLHWDSVKSMRRLNPQYDMSAGPRALTYFFQQDFAAPVDQGRVLGKLKSSLGTGEVQADQEFRKLAMQFHAEGVSSFAPFDRYRITQDYDYASGELRELVELNQGDKPWVRNRETAKLFAASKLAEAPTKLP